MRLLDLRPLSVSAVALLLMISNYPVTASAANHQVPFEVRCTITDRDHAPVENLEVRLSLDGELAAGRGAMQTDAKGMCDALMTGAIASGVVKRPTNFVDSLFSRAEATDDVRLMAELSSFGGRLLYVLEVHRFRADGALLYTDFRVFAPDKRGHYVSELKRDRYGIWQAFNLGDGSVAYPSYRVAGCEFSPDEDDPSGQRWILNCQFERLPEPVRR